MAIVKTGGPQVLCQLWNTDVYEIRQNIMRTFRHLLKTDLMFCAKSDVEFFVWKICFYNLVATLKTWLQEGTIPQVIFKMESKFFCETQILSKVCHYDDLKSDYYKIGRYV